MNIKKEAPADKLGGGNCINFNNTIIPRSMPSILWDIVSILKTLLPDSDYNCRLGVAIVKLAQMLSFKRIWFKEFENIKIINVFVINFMSSGAGKDRLCDYLDNHLFKTFILFFEDAAKTYYLKEKDRIEKEALEKFRTEKERNNYIQKQMEGLRAIEIEVNLATPEGLFQDAKTLERATFGGVFIKVSEFALLLDVKNQASIEFLKTLNDAFDGKIISKSIKYGEREKTIKNMPVNALLHTDYTLIKTSIEELMNKLFATGLARRTFVTFQNGLNINLEVDAKEARIRQKRAFERAKVIDKKVFELFQQIPNNAIYEMTDMAHDNVFHPYKLKMAELINKCEDDLLQKELISRELKVLKLAGMFACLNHPKELLIHELDFEQAIQVTEALSKDFKRFLAYKPKTDDAYMRLYNFLIDNLGEMYTKTALINKYRDFGFKRDNFRKDFDEIIEVVAEIARDNGYFLQKMPFNNNSGVKVYIFKPNHNPPKDDGFPF